MASATSVARKQQDVARAKGRLEQAMAKHPDKPNKWRQEERALQRAIANLQKEMEKAGISLPVASLNVVQKGVIPPLSVPAPTPEEVVAYETEVATSTTSAPWGKIGVIGIGVLVLGAAAFAVSRSRQARTNPMITFGPNGERQDWPPAPGFLRNPTGDGYPLPGESWLDYLKGMSGQELTLDQMSKRFRSTRLDGRQGDEKWIDFLKAVSGEGLTVAEAAERFRR